MKFNNIQYDGFDAIEILTPATRMVLVTGMGPRIAFWGKPGEDNLLYWENNDIGREDWRLLGGHRVWITRPGADESEDTYADDNEPCEIIETELGIRVSGSIHPMLKIQRGIEIQQVNENSFNVISFLTNQGPMLYSGGVWAPTCIDPCGGKEFGIILGNRELSWDLIKIVIPRTFAGHTSQINDDQICFTDDFMILRPKGVETKRMVMAPHGIIALTWPSKNLSFIKKSPFNPQGNYPLGCNLALYVGPDNFMVEMETYGAEQTVLPGETITNHETWQLVNQVFKWSKPEEVIGFFN